MNDHLPALTLGETDELVALVRALRDDAFETKQAARLQELVRDRVDGQLVYFRASQLNAALHWYFASTAVVVREKTASFLAEVCGNSVTSSLSHVQDFLQEKESTSISSDLLVVAPQQHAATGSVATPTAAASPAVIPISPPRVLRSFSMASIGRCLSAFGASPIMATLLVAIVCYGAFAILAWNLRSRALPGKAYGNGVPVAMVSGVTDVQWSPEINSKADNAFIHVGEPLKIESGTIELALNAGARLIVEGPADWSIDGDNHATLTSGKIVAKVPARAIGFTVETPTAKVVDLGTEFGVDVSDQGTAVHVFEGRVIAQFADEESQSPRQIELRSSEAARFDVGAASVSKLTAAPEQFQRTKSPTKTAAKKTNSIQPDDFKGLQLWLKADAGAYSTFSDDGDDTNDTPAEPGQSVQGWRDFSGHNRHPLQPISEHQPKLELNARQRPILRFEGDQWLERSGLVLNYADPSSFTILAAFEISALPVDARNSGSELMALFGQFSSAGDTSRYFGITSQGGLFHAEYRGDPNTVFFGQGKAIVPQRAQIGVLIREGGSRALYAIASGEGEIVTRSETSENYIGAAPILWRVGARWHPQTHEMFHGEIAEMLVYDRALSKSEQRHIEQYLANKFFAGGKALTH